MSVLEVQVEARTPRSFRLVGELDASMPQAVREAITSVFSDGAEVLVDLGGLTFIDGAGLRALVQLDDTAREVGSRLRFRNAPRPVARVVRLTGLDAILDIRPATAPPGGRG